MYIMQNNESRLIKAAKRTIRAEVTLVIVIIVISAWSIYALYKFTSGSDSFFGLNFTRFGAKENDTTSQQHQMINNHLVDPNGNPPNHRQHQQTYPLVGFNHQLHPAATTTDDAKYRSQQLLQQLLAGQRELYANLDSFKRVNPLHSIQQAAHRRTSPNNLNILDRDASRLMAGSENVLATSGYHQPLKLVEFHNAPIRQKLLSLRRPPSPLVVGAENPQKGGRQHRVETTPEPEVGDKEDEASTAASEGDKEAAESSREQGESVVDGGNLNELSSRDLPAPISVGGNEDSSSEGEDSDQDQPATGSNENQEDASSASEGNSTTIGDSSGSDDSSTTGDDLSPEVAARRDEETSGSGKETSHSIDEEVDRMTQPSSDRSTDTRTRSKPEESAPFDYKNTVQFDDSIQTGTLAVDRTADFPAQETRPKLKLEEKLRQQPLRAVGTKNDSILTGEEQDKNLTRKKMRQKVITGITNGQSYVSTPKTTERYPIMSNKTDQNNYIEVNRNHRVTNERHRFKREPQIIQETGDLDKFFRRLDFDNFLNRVTKVDSDDDEADDEAIENGYESRKSNVPPKSDYISPKLADMNKNSKEMIIPAESKAEPLTGKVGHIMSADSEPELRLEHQFYGLGNNSNSFPMPSYLTTNDSAVQELINRKQLLDSLENAQLPPPSPLADETSSLVDGSEPKTADTLFQVDYNGGLVLYPSAGHLHQQKKSHESSMSKKKKKHKKVKDKKKSTVAVKKGGHKKKKHKKEEKKFLKEKKFKAAKKGKKVSKGKGGAGGKKGKKLYKDKGYKKKGFKKVYHKEEWGNKKSFFDEFRDKDFKKKWKKFDDKYNYAQMKKYQAKDEKGAKKTKHGGESHKKYDNGKWKKTYEKKSKEHKEASKKNKKKKSEGYD